MPRRPQREDPRLLSKVSKLYYEQGLTQQEISERLHLSRPKVSRLLQRAREDGIVQITVVSPSGVYPDVEARLEAMYDLEEAVVVDVAQPSSQEAVSREVGVAAALYLQRTIADGQVIGISWGTTLNAMVSSLVPTPLRRCHVVQILGGLGPPEAETHATDLCRRMAHALGCKLTLLPAPGIVDSQEAKAVILSDVYVQRAMALFEKLDVAFVGIGAPTPNSVVMQAVSMLGLRELNDLVAQGVVGDIALRFFDAEGRPVPSDLDRRVIGITLEELKRVPRVVGVAGGPQKPQTIRAALRGRLINVLITDHVTAMELAQE